MLSQHPDPSFKEALRLAALRQYAILDTAPEAAFDDLTRLAAQICGTPICLISLSDEHRQWFKSSFGLDISEVPREITFCTYAIHQPDVMIVPDAQADERFAATPLMAAIPHLRFYAGAPLLTSEGHALGTLCVLDYIPRNLGLEQVAALRSLGHQVIAQLDLRRRVSDLERIMIDRVMVEAVLREREEQFRQLAENIRDVFFVAAPDMNQIFYVSPAYEEVWGRTCADLYEQPGSFLGAIHPSDREQVIDVEHWSEPSNTRWECRIVRPDGGIRWVRTRIFSVCDDGGHVCRLAGIAEDITERKQADLALQEAHEDLERRVVERTSDYITSNASLRAEIRERARVELALRASEERFHREAALTTALVRVAARFNARLDLEAVLAAVCEETVQALEVPSASVTLYDEQREGIYLASNIGLPPGYCQFYAPTPRSFYDLYGQQPGPIIHIPDTHIIPDLPGAQLYAAHNIRTIVVARMLYEGRLVGCLNICTFGDVRHFTDDELTMLQGLADQAALAITNARLFEAMQQELNERRRVEAALEDERALLARRVDERTLDLSTANAQLERAARLKDEFLASMSHELRTPLSTILGMAEALQEGIYGPINVDQGNALHGIEESGRHLLALINDILDLSKIEAGKLELDIDQIVVEPICQASLRLIKQAAHNKQLTVSTFFDSAVTVLQADGRRLKQILVNLLSNAIKFTSEGGAVGLEVTGDAEARVVSFTVWDTGIGIAPEEQAQLFQPFVQLDSRLARQYAGTGLGLALVARMVRLHGGSITVESTPSQGSRFTVALPWSTADDPDMLAPPAVLHSAGTLVGRRTLIIDHSPTTSNQIGRYLHELGVESVIHPCGADALAQVLAVQPDLIILDIQLPDISGWEVLARLKAEPRTCEVPVLIVSVEDDRPRAATLGADGYLLKPIMRQGLQEAVYLLVNGATESAERAEKTGTLQFGHALPLILLAEDNEHNTATLSSYLQATGYRVQVVRSGTEALAHAHDDPPALIVMDIQMPGMDGLEAIRRMRIDPALSTIPIIALTALAMTGDRARCLAAGASDYFSKPVSLKGLVNAIEAHLHNSHMLTETAND
jgi:PAS domain S-box-containing protein